MYFLLEQINIIYTQCFHNFKYFFTVIQLFCLWILQQAYHVIQYKSEREHERITLVYIMCYKGQSWSPLNYYIDHTINSLSRLLHIEMNSE